MKKTVILILLSCNIIAAFANGDPTISYSALIASANPIPMTVTDIQMISENLYIRPGRYSEVRVSYVLYNASDKDYKDLDYGFPVDYEGGGEEYLNSGLTSDYYSESMYTVGWQDKYIRRISFSLDGEVLPSKVSPETLVKQEKMPERKNYPKGKDGDEEYKIDLEYAKQASIYRRWFYTKLDIPARTAVTLDVQYMVLNRQNGSLYGSSVFSGGESDCTLQYILAPAAHWGNSKAREFYAEIDARELFDEKYPVYKYPGYEKIKIEGLPFKNKDNIYTYEATNFNFENAEPITINYHAYNNEGLSELLNKRIPADKYTVSVSTEQAAYPASNLFDLDFSTAWVAVKSGVGEKITINFKEPTMVANVVLVSGYHKSEKTFLENSRPLEIGASMNTITHNGYVYDEYTSIGFENRAYQPVLFESLAFNPHVCVWRATPLFSGYKVTKLEFDIKSIIPGTKYQDTCISEIILLDGYGYFGE